MNPCVPTPCGPNAFCKEQNSVGACYCIPEYFGNPYEGCRPECTLNTDCPSNRACINSRCKDPCPGTCGSNAECYTVNHLPICQCITGYEGNPYQYCNIRPVVVRKCILFLFQFNCWNLFNSLMINFRSRYSCPSWKSMHTNSVWSKQSMSKCKRTSDLFLHTRLFRCSSCL